MNEYVPRADKLPPDVAKQVARVSEVVAAVKKQLSPDGGRLSDGPLHLEKLEELSAMIMVLDLRMQMTFGKTAWIRRE